MKFSFGKLWARPSWSLRSERYFANEILELTARPAWNLMRKIFKIDSERMSKETIQNFRQ